MMLFAMLIDFFSHRQISVQRLERLWDVENDPDDRDWHYEQPDDSPAKQNWRQ